MEGTLGEETAVEGARKAGREVQVATRDGGEGVEEGVELIGCQVVEEDMEVWWGEAMGIVFEVHALHHELGYHERVWLVPLSSQNLLFRKMGAMNKALP